MKRKRFSVEQIVAMLKQAEMRTPVSDLNRVAILNVKVVKLFVYL